MIVITLAQVKFHLGISDTASDVAITAQLPFIDTIVKQATNRRFSFRFAADTTSASTTMTVYALYNRENQPPSGINNPYSYVDVMDSLEVGMEIEGDDIPAGAYITDLYKVGTAEVNGAVQDTVYITISDAATATAGGSTLTAGINIAYKPKIAKGVQWLIDETSTTITDTTWKSRKLDTFSVTKGDGSEKLDGKTGMPYWFIRSLPRWQR